MSDYTPTLETVRAALEKARHYAGSSNESCARIAREWIDIARIEMDYLQLQQNQPQVVCPPESWNGQPVDDAHNPFPALQPKADPEQIVDQFLRLKSLDGVHPLDLASEYQVNCLTEGAVRRWLLACATMRIATQTGS